MTHTPDLTNGVYRCPACGFHAVATQDGGIHVVDSGAGRQLHLAAIAQQQIRLRAYVESLLYRLERAYTERRVLPERNDGLLSMHKVRELSRHIKAEYGL